MVGLSSPESECSGLIVGQTFPVVRVCDSMITALRRVKTVSIVGLVTLLVGMQIVRMSATPLCVPERTWLLSLVILAGRAGRQLMAVATWLSRLETLSLVRMKWNMPLTSSSILGSILLCRHLVQAMVVSLV